MYWHTFIKHGFSATSSNIYLHHKSSFLCVIRSVMTCQVTSIPLFLATKNMFVKLFVNYYSGKIQECLHTYTYIHTWSHNLLLINLILDILHLRQVIELLSFTYNNFQARMIAWHGKSYLNSSYFWTWEKDDSLNLQQQRTISNSYSLLLLEIIKKRDNDDYSTFLDLLFLLPAKDVNFWWLLCGLLKQLSVKELASLLLICLFHVANYPHEKRKIHH